MDVRLLTGLRAVGGTYREEYLAATSRATSLATNSKLPAGSRRPDVPTLKRMLAQRPG